MNHEIPAHANIIVPRQGYKVDGNGIKKTCNINTLKSVDYFEENEKHGLLYVEFSDLYRQQLGQEEKITRLKGSNLPKPDRKKILEHYYKEIHQELVNKYKDSLTINQLMRLKLSNVPECFNSLGKYVIVVAPIDNLDNRIEIVRFLENLKDKVSSSLPRELYSSVKIMPLNKFCQD